MIINMSGVRRVCRIKHPILRESLAELIGTATLVFFGDAAIANNMNSIGSTVNVPLGYATALALAVYVSGGISGGHVNPAVTLGMCLTGRCDLNRLLPFVIAQFLGGFLGAALTHGLFFDFFKHDAERETFYNVFATYPNDFISTGGAFLDQVMGAALLVFGIMAVTDRRNMSVPKGGVPASIGLVLFGVITATGSNTGAAVNPARDFSPRLYSYIIGYQDAFKAGDHFFWIPIVACLLGGAIGALCYFFGIEVHHPPEPEAATDPDLEMRFAPTAPKGAQSGAPARGHENGTFRGDDEYPRAGGYPRDSRHQRGDAPGYPKEPGYPRELSHARGPEYRRDEPYRGDRYM